MQAQLKHIPMRLNHLRALAVSVTSPRRGEVQDSRLRDPGEGVRLPNGSAASSPGRCAQCAHIPTSPPELGFTRVRHLKWPKSDISDFGWGEVKSRGVNFVASVLGTGLLVLIHAQASAFTAYVSNEKSNTISVIDIDKFAVVKTIKVGQRPRGIELTKDEKFILVAVGDDDAIQMIDTNTHEVVATLPSGPDPELFIQDPAGKILYVANENDNTVTIIDMERRVRIGEVQVGVEPEGMGISPDGKILVNTSETTNMAHFIDTQTRQIVANVLVDARPRFAEFKRDGSELWVSSEIGGTVTVIDPVKHLVKKKITFAIPGLRNEAIQAVGINITSDGKSGFVALGPANRIAVIDGATHEVQKYLLVGQRVWHMAFTPDERYLLTTNGVSNDVSVIDVASLKVIKTIQVGELPWGVAISRQ
jgi:PQQ-dependent catabolism-associated beta-propeller protein